MDNTLIPMAVKLPQKTKNKFQQHCKANASTASQMMRYLIDQYLEKQTNTAQ